MTLNVSGHMSWHRYAFGVVLLLLLVAFILSIPFLPLGSQKQIHMPYIGGEEGDKAIVFFGFQTCRETCPVTLGVLRHLLNSNPSVERWPHVVFVDIDRNSSQKLAVDFAQQFHPQFLGVFPNAQELRELQQDFGLNIKQSGTTVFHQGRTYLLERNNDVWWLTKTYNPQTFSVGTLQQELFN